MHISDILYIFVGMWICGSIKKYFKKSLYNIKNFFVKNFPHFHTLLAVVFSKKNTEMDRGFNV